jgi:hypothetical protein
VRYHCTYMQPAEGWAFLDDTQYMLSQVWTKRQLHRLQRAGN